MPRETPVSTQSLGNLVKCLPSMASTQEARDLTSGKSPMNGKGSATTGLALQRQKLTGLQHGETGYVVISSGKEVAHQVVEDLRTGLVAAISLPRERGSLLNTEINNLRYVNTETVILSDDDEVYWSKIYIQGMAALKPSPRNKIIRRLIMLKLQKPTQAMSALEVEIFIEDIAEMLNEGGFCYQAVDEGIKNYLRTPAGAFFPPYNVLEDHIKAVQGKLKRQINMIGTLLETKKQKVLTKGEIR